MKPQLMTRGERDELNLKVAKAIHDVDDSSEFNPKENFIVQVMANAAITAILKAGYRIVKKD